MLSDVGGHVALMKRDLAVLMHSYKAGADGCNPCFEIEPRVSMLQIIFRLTTTDINR